MNEQNTDLLTLPYGKDSSLIKATCMQHSSKQQQQQQASKE